MRLRDKEMWDGGHEAPQGPQRSCLVPFLLERRSSIHCVCFFTHFLTHENLASAATIFGESLLYVFTICLKIEDRYTQFFFFFYFSQYFFTFFKYSSQVSPTKLRLSLEKLIVSFKMPLSSTFCLLLELFGVALYPSSYLTPIFLCCPLNELLEYVLYTNSLYLCFVSSRISSEKFNFLKSHLHTFSPMTII